MTKRWSSTRLDPIYTKLLTSKRARRAGRFFVAAGEHRLRVIEDPRMAEDVVELWLDGECVGRIVNIGGEVESDETSER